MAHVESIENNHLILLRCININVLIVAGLREEGVIDAAKESRLEAEKAHYDKVCLLIDWIKESSEIIYESFLQVMEENEQKHVANLLRGNVEDNHLPLSLARHARLLKIRRKLMHMIHNNSDLIAALKGSGAISQTDAEDLSVDKVPNYKKNFHLINAILRRSDYSFECLHDALRNTHQTGAADYLKEGEVIPVHANTTRPDLDEVISALINVALNNESMAETTAKEIQIPHRNGLRIVGATPGHSIVIFVYCKTTDNMVTFTQLFNSGELQTFLEDILNRLSARIEPKRTERLEARIRLDDEDILEIEEIIGIEDWMKCEQTKSPLLISHKPTEVEAKTTEMLSGEIFFALENLKVEEEVLDLSKEKQDPRDIRGIHSQRQGKPSHLSSQLLIDCARLERRKQSNRRAANPYRVHTVQRSRADTIQKNHDVLQRCTTINLYVIDFLRAEDVLDDAQESDLKAERSLVKQGILLFQWLKVGSPRKYESFLQVMKNTEQEHVANLLTGSTEEDHLPLSDVRYRCLAKIRHKLANCMHTDDEVIARLLSLKAISMIDAKEIKEEKGTYAQSSKLISAIMRRSNHSYNSFQEVLRKTSQTHAAELLSDDEMPAVHLNNTTRPDLDGPLSCAFSDVIKHRTTDDAEIKDLLAEMNAISLNLVKAVPGQ